MLINQIDGEQHDNSDITSTYTCLTVTPDIYQTKVCFAYIDFTSLDTEAGEIYVTVTVGTTFNIENVTGYYQHGASGSERIQIPEFIVRANEQVLLKVLSENSANTTVDIKSYLMEKLYTS